MKTGYWVLIIDDLLWSCNLVSSSASPLFSSASALLLFIAELQNWLDDGLVLKMLEHGSLVPGLLVLVATNRNNVVESDGDSEESVRRRMSLGRD